MQQSTSQTRIRLKDLKVVTRRRHRTLAFTAIVLFDGNPVAEARNFGHDGHTCLRPLKGASEQFSKAEAFARSLSSSILRELFPSDRHTPAILVTLECLVNHLVAKLHTDHLLRTAFRHDIRNKVLFFKDSQLLYVQGVSLKALANKKNTFAKLRELHGRSITILAELPHNQAFELWRAYQISAAQRADCH